MTPKNNGRGRNRGGHSDGALRSALEKMTQKDVRVNLLNALQDVYPLSAAPGVDLAWLAAYDLDPLVAELAAGMLLAALSEGEEPGYEIEDLVPVLLPTLHEALASPNVPDERKLRLGSLLQFCGEDPLADEDFVRLVNSEEAQERILTDMQAAITSSPATFGGLLRSIKIIPQDEEGPSEEAVSLALLLATSVNERAPLAAALITGTVAAVMAEYEIPEVAREAVQRLASMGSSEALWCLEELGRWPGVPALSLEARTAAAELARTGVTPHLALSREFSHGLMTNVDGAGSRSVNLFYRTPEGSMDLVVVLVNETRGMIDAWCLYQEAADVEEELRDTANSDESILAPCSVEFARVILADTLAYHQDKRMPLPGAFLLCRAYLGETVIEPQHHTPDLTPYRLDQMKISPDLFEGDLDGLLDSPAFSGTRFLSDAAYKFVAEHAPSRATNLSKQNLALFARTTAIDEKARLIAHLAANLETEVLAGRAHWEENQLAARTLLGLTHDVLPFHEIPYIQELCAISTEAILENLRQGFTNQAEVDRAALERGDSPWSEEEDEEDEGPWF